MLHMGIMMHFEMRQNQGALIVLASSMVYTSPHAPLCLIEFIPIVFEV